MKQGAYMDNKSLLKEIKKIIKKEDSRLKEEADFLKKIHADTTKSIKIKADKLDAKYDEEI